VQQGEEGDHVPDVFDNDGGRRRTAGSECTHGLLWRVPTCLRDHRT
jgi:hypothetical protein